MLQKPTVPFWPVNENEIVVLFVAGFVVTLRFDICERLMFPFKVRLIVFVGSVDGVGVACVIFVGVDVGVGVLIGVVEVPKAYRTP